MHKKANSTPATAAQMWASSLANAQNVALATYTKTLEEEAEDLRKILLPIPTQSQNQNQRASTNPVLSMLHKKSISTPSDDAKDGPSHYQIFVACEKYFHQNGQPVSAAAICSFLETTFRVPQLECTSLIQRRSHECVASVIRNPNWENSSIEKIENELYQKKEFSKEVVESALQQLTVLMNITINRNNNNLNLNYNIKDEGEILEEKVRAQLEPKNLPVPQQQDINSPPDQKNVIQKLPQQVA